MPTVRMKTIECGPEGHFDIGSIREVTRKQGEMLVATKHAEWADKTEPQKGAAEFATAQKGEQTAKR